MLGISLDAENERGWCGFYKHYVPTARFAAIARAAIFLAKPRD